MGKIRISHYSIHLSRYGLAADRPFSAAVLADLHNRVYHSDIDSLMDAIRHAGCDLVLSAGDLVVMKAGRFSTDQALDLIGRLTAEYPVYTANGNHETRMLRLHPDEYERYTAKLQELGAVNLVNEARSIQICGTLLHIAGLELERMYSYAEGREEAGGCVQYPSGSPSPVFQRVCPVGRGPCAFRASARRHRTASSCRRRDQSGSGAVSALRSRTLYFRTIHHDRQCRTWYAHDQSPGQ